MRLKITRVNCYGNLYRYRYSQLINLICWCELILEMLGDLGGPLVEHDIQTKSFIEMCI